jgi:UDP-2-acetamido-3-amino-2,3-dideoxy-glucuronate N-acetyltransferase
MISKIKGVTLINFPNVLAERGNLTALELPEIVPFNVKRIFLVHRVTNTQVRGEHAHKKCWQLLIAANGSVSVDLSDGDCMDTFKLDNPNEGLVIPPLTWGTQYNFSKHAALLVLASDPYDEKDYIHDFYEFKKIKSHDC